MSHTKTDDDARVTKLEELTFFQEERLRALDAALTAQQLQMDRLEHDLAKASVLIRALREKLEQQPDNALPPHFMPERW